jgi:hypothetical protein
MSNNLIETINEIEVLNNSNGTESSFDIINGSGIDITKENGNYTISSNSSGILIDELGSIPAGDTIQNALEHLQSKINDVDNISSGLIIRTTEDGKDVDYPNVKDLLGNTMYLRLVSDSGRVIHISAYEIDRALDTIALLNNDKADKSVVDDLAAALEGKASAVKLELFEANINEKADKSEVSSIKKIINKKADIATVTELSTTVANKADIDTVAELSTTVANKADIATVTELSTIISNKANIETVVKMQNDVQALHNTLNSLSDTETIKAIKNQINYLNSEIQRRLTIDDLNSLLVDNTELINQVEANTTSINNIEHTLSNKASIPYVQKELNDLNSIIANVSAKTNSKADKSAVATKASQEDLNLLAKKFNDLSASTTTNIEELTNSYSKLQETVDNKATKKIVRQLSEKMDVELEGKLDKSTFVKTVNNINNKIDNIDLDTPISDINNEIHNVQTSLNNKLSNLQSTISTHNKKISQHEDKIAKMQDIDTKLERAVSTEWVRVMTPEDYNKLSKNPNYSDGTKNPNAVQPNTVYMIVKYNKPVAIYIGTILIAEAKQEGPAGFTYNFPIVFG